MNNASSSNRGRNLAGIVLIVLAVLVSACAGKSSADRGNNSDQGNANQVAATAAAPTTAAAGSGQPATNATNGSAGQGAAGDFTVAVRNVAQKVKPAVVQITNEQVQVGQFGQATVPAGVGSGVIYDEQGHIITNNHVVAGAQQLAVSLPDGRTFRAKLLGADPRTDLAVIQISGDNLPVAQLGDSKQLRSGTGWWPSVTHWACPADPR